MFRDSHLDFDLLITKNSVLLYSGTPAYSNAYYSNTTLTKEMRAWQEALESQLCLEKKMRPKNKT